ncbi:MAG: phosphatase PAP2 family protein [Prevotellaceae bacterium]|nr:phosphatase PAP2 family protein [Prevotellaceae bacterium]
METLIELDRSLLYFFNGSSSLFLDNLAVVLTSGLTWIPLYLALVYVVIKNNETMGQIMLAIGCGILCVVISDGLVDFIVKPLVARYRPSHEPSIKYIVDIVNDMRDTKYGFFSAHASNTFCIAVFFSLLIRNRVFTTIMVLWSLLNCWTRMYLGLHYPGDIFVGLVWGGIVGCLVYYLYMKTYLKMSQKINYVSSQYTSTGYSYTDLDIVSLVMTLILLYAIFRALIVFV